MNILIIYDSLYGNTKTIAETLGKNFSSPHKVRLLNATHAKTHDFKGAGLVIVGSPTHGGRAKPTLQEFLDHIPNETLKDIPVAVFDTRLDITKQPFLLRLLMNIIGYAAPKIGKILENKGGNLITPPEGFFVTGKKGPLPKEELDRAKAWGKTIQQKI